ncbi:ELWxxDGT repeat protein [Novipirellula sp. SH528]|uniref:ELWxxDGT repeat protein n=1 Tax=Novipirellula sp. SH528 TaxID=3454466 RepID=UPI003FA12670
MLTGVTIIDINQIGAGSEPYSQIVVGDQAFFAAHDGIHGTELWKTDGTDAGTVLVKDIFPGSQASIQTFFSQSADVDGTLFFGADDGVHGFELWKSDGTESGTVLVKDIFPGNNLSRDIDLSNFTSHRGLLYFFADDGVHGQELWTSDGTEAGTTMLRDLNPDGGQFNSPGFIASFGDVVLFGATDGVNGLELWKTDGTDAGTSMVADIRTGEISPGNPASGFFGKLTVSGSFAYFTGNNGTSGIELFRTDGTAAGTQLLEIAPGNASSGPISLTDVGGTLFFAAVGPGGRELYKSDGLPTGTVRVKDINPSGDGLTLSPLFTAVGNKLFFEADDGTTGEELWVSDGTDSGTLLVEDIRPGNGLSGTPLSAFIRFIVDVGGTAFFSAVDGDNGGELWKSDGTEAGTQVVRDINPGPASGLDFRSVGMAFGDQLLFPAEDGNGVELWKSDGSATGTAMVKDIDTISTRDSRPALYSNAVAELNGQIFFRADIGNDFELVKSDGTRSGTTVVKNIRDDGGSFPSSPTTVGDLVFFTARDDEHGGELWKTDGTDAGTLLVKDILGGTDGSYPHAFAELNGKLIFSANDGVNGDELWISDGTEIGTTLLKNIRSGSASSEIFTSDLGSGRFNGELFFSANDGVRGDELWKTNGTAEGTVLVKDFRSGDSNPSDFVVFGESLFFSAKGVEGRELWKTDGTEAGTELVKNINGTAADSLASFGALFVEAGTLYLAADDGVNGIELWKSDGTEAGTVLVKDINPGSVSSSPRFAGSIGNTVLFSAQTVDNGSELWKTDGTTAGTILVKDIQPGPDSGAFYIGRSVNAAPIFEGNLYFGGNDGTSGNELWKSDGTDAGTMLVEDIFPGRGGSYPRGFQQVAGRLLFSAGGEGGFSIPAGRELIRLGTDPAMVTALMTDAISVDVDNDGKLDPGDTLKYTTTLSVGTDADADAVLYSQTMDANTMIVPGSVSTSQGTITVGSNGGQKLEIGFGSIPANGVVTVTYSVRVNDTLPNGVTQITNQATISGNNFADVPTDDPALEGTTDPTSIAVQNGPAGIAPVATDFPVGNVPKGTLVSIDAVNLISEFGTDVDSVLTSNSVTFGAVTIGGSTVGSIADAGFIYTPGSGPAGAFTIDTTASAFAGLMASQTANVVINFTVSDGKKDDTGVLTFTVSAAAGQYDAVGFHFLGATVVDREVKATAVAAAGKATMDASISGVDDVSDTLGSVDIAKGELSIQQFQGDMLTIAEAVAVDASTANATSTNGSTSIASASKNSNATSTARGNSVASTDASDESEATAIANDNSAASATASKKSDASATAEEGSAAEATADDDSNATAVAKVTSNATASAAERSVSIATADGTSSATAFGKTDSVSSANSLSNSISNAVAVDGSGATATATDGSDALALGEQGSASEATSNTASSASASAEGGSNSTAIASSNSTATANSTTASSATSNAATSSVSNAEASGGGGIATAVSDMESAASAVAKNGLDAVAKAAQKSAADANAGSDAVNEISITTDGANVVVTNTPLTTLTGTKGASIDLPIQVVESGGAAIQSIMISNLPAGSKLSGGTSNANGSEWTFADLPPSDLELTLPADFVGEFALDVTAKNSDDVFAKATLNGLVTAPPEIHATISDKIINDDGTGTANPGETIEYLLTVRNDGSGDALNVVVADILDPNMSLVPGSVSVNPNVANAAFPINVGTIAAGTSVTVRFHAQVNPATATLTGSVANQARISGSNFDDVLSDDPTTRFVNDSTMTPLDHRNTVIVDGPSTRTVAGLNLATDISDDGQRIVFISNLDRTGNNADKSFELFVFDIPSNQVIQVTDVTANVNIVIQPPVTNANGSRILFVSNGDFAGENADGNEELFLVDLTATGSPRFTQITNTESGKDSSGFELTTAQSLSFSNDGTKIVFQSNSDVTGDNAGNKTEVFLFDTETSMLIQVTGGTSGINSAFDAVISGDGTRIAMVSSDEFSGGNSDRSEELFAYDIAAKTFQLLTDTNVDQLRSDDIAISDDGKRIAILFDGDSESTVVLYDENASQPISQLLTLPGTVGTIEISGDGTTIVLVEVPSDDANFSNVVVLDVASKTKTNLTNVTVGASLFAFVNRDGSRIAFSSTANLTGENLDGNPEVFYTTGDTITQIAEIEQTPENSSAPSYSGDGTAIFFVTNGGEGVFGIRDSKLARLDLATGKVTPLVTVLPFTGSTIGNPDANFDGTFIAFDSNDMDFNTLDTNEDGSREIFVYDAITEELLQVTHSQNPATVSSDPSISHDGRRVVYVSSTQGNRAAFLATLSPTAAPSISSITQSDSGDASGVVISGNGSMVALASTGNESGNNTDANRELFVFDITTKTLTQITKTTGGTGGENPSANLDGTLIAFESDRDLTGENADGNREIFLVNLSNPAVPVFTQFTDTLGGANRRPQISDDGTIIVFESDRDLTGGNGENDGELYLYQVPLDMFLPIINLAGADDSLHASVSASGKKIAFSSMRNLDGQNQDGSSEIFTAEAISPEVDISITISESVDPVNITSSAGSLTYVVRVNNLGTETATGITINSTLTLPSGVTIESAVASSGSFAGSIWNLGTLSSGASATLTFTLAVSATATAGNDVIAGSAMLAAIDQFDANPANNSASVATSISREASGVLNRETVNVAKSAEVVSRAANLNVPGLNANVLEGVDLNDEAAIRTALIVADVNANSINITVTRRDDGQTVGTNTEVTFSETPGTVFTGDINNPDTITVLSGQLNITTTITTTTTQRFTDVVTITGMLDEKAGCLTSAPLVVGENMLTYSCATPGAFVAFVIGTQPGSHFFSKYNATVDIADPSVPMIRVANIDGIAQIPFNLTAEQVQSNLRFQAFEMLPTVQVSNVLTVLSSLDISGDGRVTVMDALLVVNRLPLLKASGESESIGRPSRNYDANRDGRVSALDALTIINHVNRQSVASAEAITLSPMTSGIGFADDLDDDLDDDLLQMLADDRLRQR